MFVCVCVCKRERERKHGFLCMLDTKRKCVYDCITVNLFIRERERKKRMRESDIKYERER
jgi:hypothetical protein